MAPIYLSENKFDHNGFWELPIGKRFPPIAKDFALFDQNGYDLTPIEQQYAVINRTNYSNHREHQLAIKRPWYLQEDSVDGPVLNHSLIFERKGYAGAARDELKNWAGLVPLCYKLINLRPKWGLDFSLDYVDRQGNCFEIVHWEYDCFDVNEAEDIKSVTEDIIKDIDWEDGAKYLIKHHDQWIDLDFFAQSAWKCNYFGIVEERFKVVAWK
jgi:hypothetical protein